MLTPSLADVEFFFDNLLRCQECGSIFVVVRPEKRKAAKAKPCPICHKGKVDDYLEGSV